MQPSSDRFIEVTPSPHPHEREALAFVRDLLPDHEPYRAWANFEFRAADGSINEVDLLVLAKKGAFLIEIKSWPGAISGDWGGWTWTRDGRRSSVDNPIPLLDRKCKRLKALLTPYFAKSKARAPFFTPLVFLSAEGLQLDLDPETSQSSRYRRPARAPDRHGSTPAAESTRWSPLAARRSRPDPTREPVTAEAHRRARRGVRDREAPAARARPGDRRRRAPSIARAGVRAEAPGRQ